MGHKHTMTAQTARQIAERFLTTVEMRGFRAVFSGVHGSSQTEEWSVIFEVHSAEGHLMDGPIIVVVDKTTAAARLFASP
jgi:hypothetical protein